MKQLLKYTYITFIYIEFIQSIIESIDQGEKVKSIFLNLTRAFDCVSHTKRLHSLEDLGFNGKSWNGLNNISLLGSSKLKYKLYQEL